jgi:hypothetical protein
MTSPLSGRVEQTRNDRSRRDVVTSQNRFARGLFRHSSGNKRCWKFYREQTDGYFPVI